MIITGLGSLSFSISVHPSTNPEELSSLCLIEFFKKELWNKDGSVLVRLEEFINLFEEDQILKIEGDTVEFDRETFDGETTKVVQFYNDKF